MQRRTQNKEFHGLTTTGYIKTREKYYNPSKPYLKFTTFIITKKGNPLNLQSIEDLNSRTIALQKNNLMFKKIVDELDKDIKLLWVDSIDEMIRSVSSGKADFTVLDETVFYIAKKIGLQGYIDTPFTVGKPFDILFWFTKDYPELQTIVNKALDSINAKEKSQLRDNWFKNKKELDYELFIKIFVVLSLIALFILYRQWILKKKNDDLEKLQKIIEEKSLEVEEKINTMSKYIIFSRTDLNGVITDVSDAFINTVQYSKEELLGKEHNIVRHPDMPKSAFEDMWKTIQDGKLWRGEVKNRKKDGTYYWADTRISAESDKNGNTIGYIAIRTDITDKKRIEQIAITDGLTSLYNRRHFDSIFPQQIKINKREKGILAFLLVDIDHFKQYNDTYGHQEGDTALRLVAQALKDTLQRPNDYTFRLGGEEFGLLYQIKNEEDGFQVANKARVNIENLKIDHSGNSASKYVTISSGLYIIKSNDNPSINEIYKKTDEALYIAKQNGRNQIGLI
jgi:diguanylate cyclase (GGDEF)-like protein/PAS domain S-box-containing protein